MPSRREFLLGAGAAGTAAVAGCLDRTDADPGTDDEYAWPTAGADLRNSRTVPDGVAPRETATVEWHAELESGLAAGEPIVTDDTVLVTTGQDIVAFDRDAGERRWSIDPDNEAYSYNGSPTVFDGLAYVPEGSTLTARDLESGEIQWSVDLGYVISRGSLTVTDTDDGRVYVAAGNAVYALDAADGERLWEQDLLGIARYALAKYTDWLFVATRGGELYKLRRWEGLVEWRRTIEAGLESAPTVLTSDDRRTGMGVAVARGDGVITYFDIDGTREWRTELGGFGHDGLAIGHRTLLAQSGSTLHALDTNDGGHRWRVDLGTGATNPPIVVGDTVYVGGDRLRAIDIDGGVGIRTLRIGEQRFEHDVPGSVDYVTAADGNLFVTTNTWALEDETAKLLVLS